MPFSYYKRLGLISARAVSAPYSISSDLENAAVKVAEIYCFAPSGFLEGRFPCVGSFIPARNIALHSSLGLWEKYGNFTVRSLEAV